VAPLVMLELPVL